MESGSVPRLVEQWWLTRHNRVYTVAVTKTDNSKTSFQYAVLTYCFKTSDLPATLRWNRSGLVLDLDLSAERLPAKTPAADCADESRLGNESCCNGEGSGELDTPDVSFNVAILAFTGLRTREQEAELFEPSTEPAEVDRRHLKAALMYA